MGRLRKTQLEEKHWQALKLVEDGDLSYKDIAAKMGWSADYFYDLKSGNIKNCGYIAELFSKEFKKVEAKREDKVKVLIKDNIASAQELIKRVLADLKSKSRITPEDKKIISMYTNALAKCTPSVSINSVSYSYTKGLTAEELVHEFKRLKTIAEQSFDRRGVPEALEGGPGTVSAVDE